VYEDRRDFAKRVLSSPEVPGVEAVLLCPPKTPSPSAPTAPCRFGAKLRRSSLDEKWGITVEAVPKIATLILSVKNDSPCPVREHNSSAASAWQIREGDFILSANGVKDDLAIATLLSDSLALDLVLERAQLIDTTVSKRGRPLGLTLHHQENGAALYVQGIADESAVRASGADVSLGDRIVQVNGRSAKAWDLIQALKASDATVLTIARRAEVKAKHGGPTRHPIDAKRSARLPSPHP